MKGLAVLALAVLLPGTVAWTRLLGKAEMLATAGSWIKYQYPEAADRFYKELVRCCGTTDLGRKADDLRWFPRADACPAEDGGDEE